MDALQRLITYVLSHPQLFVVLLIIGGPMLRSVVKGLAEAKRRQREVEERRGGRVLDTNDPDVQEREEEVVVEEPPPIPETEEEEEEVVARPAPEPVLVVPPIPPLSPTEVEAEPRPLLLGLEPPEFAATPSFSDVIAARPARALLEEVGHGAEAGGFAFRIPTAEEDWRTALVLSEILGPPVSMRRILAATG